MIGEVVGQAATAENGSALVACFCVPVAQVAGAIGAFSDRIPSAIFPRFVAGMPHFENIAGGHRPKVYSRRVSSNQSL